MKLIIIIFFIVTETFLFSLELIEPNFDLELNRQNNYVYLRNERQEIFSDKIGSPAIPLKSVFFEIPRHKKIKSVTVVPQKIRTVNLEKPLFPVQKPNPLNKLSAGDFVLPAEEYYSKEIFPADWIYEFDSGKSGDRIIGFVSFYTCRYFPDSKKLEIPAEFDLQIEFSDDNDNEIFPSNYASLKVLEILNLGNSTRDENIKYLLIAPQQFLEEYEPLLEWRRIQGIEVFSQSVEEIEVNEPGNDLQEKIRNYILDMYNDHEISFVTLGADTDFIPDRKTFAFDCEYGLYDDENDLPCDMYYSCLNGDWDENGNGIFGEEEDNVDYFPEVFVGRIPANSTEQVSSYIAELIDYESGEFSDYNTAGGLSMALWAGSDSEVCQQYIYDNYFPEYYDINFLYGAENTTDNAFAMLNSNPNIVQHTGHAGTSALSLQNGHITLSNLSQLNNDFGGIFYSIGCWSAAFDYNSVGENLVIIPNKGMLGYIGNSRYGWGSPSASGFGFSEFYQKEFFKNLFWEEKTILAEGNALQKLPFVPYFGGTSVYKWVAYELNALGDSFFRLFIDNPQSFDFSVSAGNDSLYFFVSAENQPLANVVITKGEFQTRSDENGNATLPDNGETETIYFYKYGYRLMQTESSEVQSLPYIAEITGNEENYYIQGENLTINSVLFNPTFIAYNISVEYEFNSDELEIVTYENPTEILDFSQAELSPIDIHIKSIAESYQMENGKEIYLREKIFNEENGELLAQTVFTLKIEAPELKITGIVFGENTISGGSQIAFDLTVKNTGFLAGSDLTCLFDSPFEEIDFAEDNLALSVWLPYQESVEISNELMISETVPEDFLGTFSVNMETENNGQNYSYENTIYLPVGNIGIYDDFEEDENWNHSPEWQHVSTFAFGGNYSFSCRPQNIGSYSAESPVFVYLPGTELSFQYKYKMPMYGEDGVYITLNYGSERDTLIFLGAGGALPDDRPVPQAYIECDWAEYSLNLDEILVNQPQVGTTFTIEMLFKFAEEIEGFNQYAQMDSIGVFIDDFAINANGGIVQTNENVIASDFLKISPNPVIFPKTVSFYFSSESAKKPEIAIYNIKGQKVKSWKYTDYDGRSTIPFSRMDWNGKDDFGKTVNSGIYFLQIKMPQKTLSQKFIILKN